MSKVTEIEPYDPDLLDAEDIDFGFYVQVQKDSDGYSALLDGDISNVKLHHKGKIYSVLHLLALIAACDAALDWADANARAFPIETASRDQKILLWNDLFNTWVGAWWSEGDEYPKLTSMLVMDVKYSKFWRPEPPPPSNPPLPAPLERLGEVLRKVKGTT